MSVGNVICVGTSHGLILVFEPTQALKWCLGSNQVNVCLIRSNYLKSQTEFFTYQLLK